MSRKRSSSSDSGCLVALFPLILVLGIIGTVLEFIAENIGIILIVLAVVGAIIGIVVAINNATKKKEAEEAEKQRNLAIINAPETKPSLTNIPTSSSFANKEEESVNLAFREFLRHNNDVVLANGHLDFLTNKANAFRALGKNEEALQIDSEITQAKTALSAVQSKKSGTFESKFNAMFYRATEIRNAYSTFVNKLPNERLYLTQQGIMEAPKSVEDKLAAVTETLKERYASGEKKAYTITDLREQNLDLPISTIGTWSKKVFNQNATEYLTEQGILSEYDWMAEMRLQNERREAEAKAREERLEAEMKAPMITS